MISFFRNKYVSLIFDSGTVQKLHSLEFLIKTIDSPPYLDDSKPIFEYATSEVYKKTILEVINQLITNKFRRVFCP